MADLKLVLAKAETELALTARMGNRHGLIAGATGTGKTVTLQKIAESFSQNGVPVFLADIKGDLSGISRPGQDNPRITDRVKQLGLPPLQYQGNPVQFWDILGEQGHPVRATISDMGPLLFSRLLDLNETQSGVLNIVFKIADDNGMLLLDLKDLMSMLDYVGKNASDFTTEYGNISAATIGAIQRGLVALEQQGADRFFGEPMLDIMDMMKTDSSGKGTVNILAADKLMQTPRIYSTFLLWLMSELFEQMPEVGDLEKPKMVFFFDEAHLLFNEAPKALLEKIEQVVRLIRSKGIGIYFVTQNPLDIPDTVLGQLGNRVQHALRAYTPRDQKAVKTAAETFRPNPKLNVEQAITELGVGEALISFLDEKGIPGIVERAFIIPPSSQIGPVTPQEKEKLLQQSPVYGRYEKTVDRESAYEILQKRSKQAENAREDEEKKKQESGRTSRQEYDYGEPGKRRSRRTDSTGQTIVKSLARAASSSIGRSVGRELVRGILGSLFKR